MQCKSATAPATVTGDEACENHWETEKIQVVRRSGSQETCHTSLFYCTFRREREQGGIMKDTSFNKQTGINADWSGKSARKCAEESTRKSARSVMAGLVAAAALMLTACGQGASEQENTPTPAPTSTESATPVPVEKVDAEYPKTIALPDGTSVTLEKEIESIVSMGPNITEILFAIGAGDKVIGRTDYCDYPAEVTEIPSVGTIYMADIERIIELNPDMVIGSSCFADESANRLKELGICEVTLWDATNLDGVYGIIDTLGELTGCEEAAEALVADTKARIDAVKQEAEAFVTRPTVYYSLGYGEYGDYTAGGDTFIGQMLTQAGGINAAEDVSGWNYSLEALLEADPDVIIMGLGEAEDFKKAEHYCELSAVKNNRVYEIDRNLFDRQCHRNAEAMETLVDIFKSVSE